MLSRQGISRFVVCLFFGAALNVAPVPTIAAGNPVICSSGETWSPVRGTCVLRASTLRKLSVERTRSVLGRQGQQASVKRHKCVSPYSQKEMPCVQGVSRWSNDQGCYVSLTDPQPSTSDQVWEGHTKGAIYDCYSPDLVGTRLTVQWSATPPPGLQAPPDVRLLSRQAVAGMELKAIRIGIVPEDRARSVGIVGLPTWMWVAARGPSTWGPITRTASAGGFSVTARARVRRVVWAMGDGSVVTCTGPGTVYVDSFGRRSSPDCGHTYTRQGTYTVRATSYWVVEWAGIGQRGTIPLSFTQRTVITMGEAQVLTQ